MEWFLRLTRSKEFLHRSSIIGYNYGEKLNFIEDKSKIKFGFISVEIYTEAQKLNSGMKNLNLSSGNY
jgi:hypothetical protein